MTDQHPIVPSPELVKQWKDEWYEADRVETSEYTYIANQAARWGADRELIACCGEVSCWESTGIAKKLREARRPKPPSLKEQALAVLDDVSNQLDAAHENALRRALEALPND